MRLVSSVTCGSCEQMGKSSTMVSETPLEYKLKEPKKLHALGSSNSTPEKK
jgi:hypothetical protein